MVATIIQLDPDQSTASPFLGDAEVLKLQSREKICIYKSPIDLRTANRSAFIPDALLIGPLQHHNKKIARERSRWQHADDKVKYRYAMYQKVEEQKSAYVESFRKRFGSDTIGQCRNYIEQERDMIRACYAEQTDGLLDEKFVKMVLRDSVFLIEILFTKFFEDMLEIDGIQLNNLVGNIYGDLFLLENQLPFFVLENLYDNLIIRKFPLLGHSKFRQLTFNFFGIELDSSKEFQHFTDLFRLARINSLPSGSFTKKIDHLYSAEKLHAAGIDFMLADEGDSLTLEDGFWKTKLKMGCFVADNLTERALMNVMALESCHYRDQMYVSSYVELLGFLVGTIRDVDILAESGIIRCKVQQSSVLNIITKLNQGLTVNSCYYELSENLKLHYKSRRKRTMGMLKRVYCPNLLTGTATAVASIVLVLVFIQTTTSILQV